MTAEQLAILKRQQTDMSAQALAALARRAEIESRFAPKRRYLFRDGGFIELPQNDPPSPPSL